MTVTMVELLGLMAGTLTTFSFLPQVLKVFRERSAAGISGGMYVIFCVGILLWAVYGFMIESVPVILTNLLTFALAGTVLVLKIIWR